MSNTYLVWKTLHIVGVVLMVGNVTVTGAWAAILWRHRDRGSLRPMIRGILWTDLIFTFGGGVLMTVAGIQMIRLGEWPWRDTAWLMQGIVALAVATLIWMLVLLPDQIRMDRCAAGDRERFGRLFRRWTVCGWVATVILYYGIWLMVTKRA